MQTEITRELAQAAIDQLGWKSLVWLDEVDSTQRVANELAAEASAAPPILVIAARQTAGRGRGQNHWRSANAALTFSFVIDADSIPLANDQLPAASIAVAAGICNAVERFGDIHCGVKWPNDVYARGKKLSGLLIDVKQRSPSLPARLVVGVGVNVNHTPVEQDASLAATAVSVRECCSGPVDIGDLLTSLLMHIVQSLEMLAEPADAEMSRWNDRSVLNGREVCIESSTGQLRGRVIGLQNGGQLLLEQQGVSREVITGSVVEISPPL